MIKKLKEGEILLAYYEEFLKKVEEKKKRNMARMKKLDDVRKKFLREEIENV